MTTPAEHLTATLDILDQLRDGLRQRIDQETPGVKARAYDQANVTNGGGPADPTGTSRTDPATRHLALHDEHTRAIALKAAQLHRHALALARLDITYPPAHEPDAAERRAIREANDPTPICHWCDRIDVRNTLVRTQQPSRIKGRLEVAVHSCGAHYDYIAEHGEPPTDDQTRWWHDHGYFKVGRQTYRPERTER